MFLYGAPGAGKTHVSQRLGEALDYQVVEGDKLRYRAREEINFDSRSFLSYGIAKAHRFYGDLTKGNCVSGLKGVRLAMGPIVESYIRSRRDDYILEAPFLDPASCVEFGCCFLMAVPDSDLHRRRMGVAREEPEDIDELFQASRYVQDFMIREAEVLGVPIITNPDDAEQACSRIIGQLRL